MVIEKIEYTLQGLCCYFIKDGKTKAPKNSHLLKGYTICDLNDKYSNLGLLTPGIRLLTPLLSTARSQQTLQCKAVVPKEFMSLPRAILRPSLYWEWICPLGGMTAMQEVFLGNRNIPWDLLAQESGNMHSSLSFALKSCICLDSSAHLYIQFQCASDITHKKLRKVLLRTMI